SAMLVPSGNHRQSLGVYGRGETCKGAAPGQRMKNRRADAGVRKALVQRFWRTARRFWTEEARAVAWLMTISLVVITCLQLLIQYRINVWNRDIFDAIEKKNAAAVVTEAMLFVPLAVSGVALAVLAVRSLSNSISARSRWRAARMAPA